MKRVLVIDNYDSFTFNLVHYLEDLDCHVTVVRNDQFELELADQYTKILLSPGPGIPEEAGLLKPLIQQYASTKSILGICLGQQAIAEVFGGTLINLDTVFHGVATTIQITDKEDNLFKGLESTMEVGRYHSWVVSPILPDCLVATSVDSNGHIMSLKHTHYDVRSVQFHPESILTPNGKQILKNWLNT